MSTRDPTTKVTTRRARQDVHRRQVRRLRRPGRRRPTRWTAHRLRGRPSAVSGGPRAHPAQEGWWGKQTVVGPDGRPQVAKLGSPRRLKTIFRTNLRVSTRRCPLAAHPGPQGPLPLPDVRRRQRLPHPPPAPRVGRPRPTRRHPFWKDPRPAQRIVRSPRTP